MPIGESNYINNTVNNAVVDKVPNSSTTIKVGESLTNIKRDDLFIMQRTYDKFQRNPRYSTNYLDSFRLKKGYRHSFQITSVNSS
jgi:hypothetical protein